MLGEERYSKRLPPRVKYSPWEVIRWLYSPGSPATISAVGGLRPVTLRRTLSSGLPFSGSDVYVTWIFLTLNPPNVLRSRVDRFWVHFAANLERGIGAAKIYFFLVFHCAMMRQERSCLIRSWTALFIQGYLEQMGCQEVWRRKYAAVSGNAGRIL